MTEVTQADQAKALQHLGFDSMEDAHYWAVDNNELNRLDALIQMFAEHREAALTAQAAEIAALRAENERLREALVYCKQEAYCSVDPEHGSVDRYGYGRIEKRARQALKDTTHD